MSVLVVTICYKEKKLKTSVDIGIGSFLNPILIKILEDQYCTIYGLTVNHVRGIRGLSPSVVCW